MSDVTEILDRVKQGDPRASSQLLPLVYSELRRLAERKMASESPGQTLQPTALVHEAFLRLVGPGEPREWDGRGHFFAAAAQAMRRILVENARRKRSEKHGGELARCELQEGDGAEEITNIDSLIDLDEAITKLAVEEPELARLVELRYFAGLTIEQTARAMGYSPRTVKRNWAFARAWLGRELTQDGSN
jgi:RNA polymerase sigma factor (TIGR02999 family)